MELIKCKVCGHYMESTSATQRKCIYCGKTYGINEYDRYTSTSGYYGNISTKVDSYFNKMLKIELVDLLNDFLANFDDKEDLWYACYDIEHHLALLGQKAFEDDEYSFVHYPYQTNSATKVTSIASNVLDMYYVICQNVKPKISMDFITFVLSIQMTNMAVSAWNNISDRWNRYIQDEDSLSEFIRSVDNVIGFLEIAEKYGPVFNLTLYDDLIFLQEQQIKTTYPHEYYNGYRYVTEHIGLTESAKQSRRNTISKYRVSKSKIESNIKAYKDRIEKERQAALEKAKKERRDSFWAVNQDLKLKLENERKQLTLEVNELIKQRDAINCDKELNDIKDEIMIVNTALASLGIFAGKEKKAKKARILELENEIPNIKQKMQEEKNKVQKVIDSKVNRMKEIDAEFIKDR